jgi:hypothetical protein
MYHFSSFQNVSVSDSILNYLKYNLIFIFLLFRYKVCFIIYHKEYLNIR